MPIHMPIQLFLGLGGGYARMEGTYTQCYGTNSTGDTIEVEQSWDCLMYGPQHTMCTDGTPTHAPIYLSIYLYCNAPIAILISLGPRRSVSLSEHPQQRLSNPAPPNRLRAAESLRTKYIRTGSRGWPPLGGLKMGGSNLVEGLSEGKILTGLRTSHSYYYAIPPPNPSPLSPPLLSSL